MAKSWLQRQLLRKASVDIDLYRHLVPIQGVPRINGTLSANGVLRLFTGEVIPRDPDTVLDAYTPPVKPKPMPMFEPNKPINMSVSDRIHGRKVA